MATDWAQVWTQIAVAPVAATGATLVAASWVVRRQASSTKRMENRAKIESILMDIEKEMRVFIHKHRTSAHETIGQLYFANFVECSQIMELADWLSRWERKRYRRFCKRAYGGYLLSKSLEFPSETDGSDEMFREMDYRLIDSDGNAIGVDAVEADLLSGMVERGKWLYRASEDDPYVDRDAQARGLINVYRMTSLAEFRVWGDTYEIRLSLAKKILKCARYTRRRGRFWSFMPRFYAPTYLKIWPFPKKHRELANSPSTE
jgi:hypothetical protein